MTDAQHLQRASTHNTKYIKASQDVLYQAFTDPMALATWQAPGDMTAEVHRFDGRVGGGYQMSLYYPESEESVRGKTAGREDRYTACFLELRPPSRIVETITFDTGDPALIGEMIMEVTLEPEGEGTEVIIVFKEIPPGIRAEDNELGTRLSLEKLECYVE
ncbi:hypothetical protein KDA_47650 [Dictyobacter alpinus]|uniref:Activator of Hsp90 ATPase homologue 1/2-like C-terminal domain-containing protein n=1 Tax=Dictyobacter alpinus TaxID=2014873 RepID=A0A402BD08_9CHLR|nr:SRPBCC domain-containing protein [Dictyobacter alpinus]GCE29281.1 hypothetical protein KDA_47650 [Dictyobacter alpinus]